MEECENLRPTFTDLRNSVKNSILSTFHGRILQEPL